jgi:isopentenyl-diphosphate delta-isomerase
MRQVTHENKIQENEHQHVFRAELKGTISTLKMQIEEVTGL